MNAFFLFSLNTVILLNANSYFTNRSDFYSPFFFWFSCLEFYSLSFFFFKFFLSKILHFNQTKTENSLKIGYWFNHIRLKSIVFLVFFLNFITKLLSMELIAPPFNVVCEVNWIRQCWWFPVTLFDVDIFVDCLSIVEQQLLVDVCH